jgi:hypothetical protein
MPLLFLTIAFTFLKENPYTRLQYRILGSGTFCAGEWGLFERPAKGFWAAPHHINPTLKGLMTRQSSLFT